MLLYRLITIIMLSIPYDLLGYNKYDLLETVEVMCTLIISIMYCTSDIKIIIWR